VRFVTPIIGLALLATVACGGTSTSPPAGSTVVKLSEYKFDPNQISHKAGNMTFFLENVGSVAHDMVIFNSSNTRVAASELVQSGDSVTFSTVLSAGSYRFICDQPGHEGSGMKGNLTVT